MTGELLSTRRGLIFGVGGIGLAAAASPLSAEASRLSGPLEDLDPVKTELVMNLVVTCSSPEYMAPNRSKKSSDGDRDDIWPIIGGRFWGPRISGRVVPGGADFPVVRPDGVVVIDAFYQLQADDGTNIIIHNKGFGYPPAAGLPYRYRLMPTFTTVEGPHDWLNKSLFIATLIADEAFPKNMALAEGADQNDRLIQVHRIV